MNKPKIYRVSIKEEGSFFNYSECIKTFKEIIIDKHNEPELEIIVKEKINEFDFALIGHLILMKIKFPAIIISLIFQKNAFEDSRIKDVEKHNHLIWKIRQSMVHAYFASNIEVFSIIDSSGEIANINTEIKRKGNWFVFSTEFLPIISINEDNYKGNFEKSVKFLKIKNPISELRSEDDFYGYCRDFLIKKINHNNYYQIMAQLAYYKTLQSARSLRHYLFYVNKDFEKKLDRDSIYVGNVQDDSKKRAYWEEIIPIFKELKNRPPIYSLIFSTLTSSKKFITTEIGNANIEEVSKELIKLWEFTKQLIYGLNELAKNIVEHTTSKHGILTGYITGENEFKINIFDYGNKSIITTLKETTKATFNSLKETSILKQLFNDDYDTLCGKDFKFEYLFNSNQEHLLNQQTKRATIHLGLLILSRLISENKGKLFVSSSDSERVHIYPEKEKSFGYFPIGTNYQIQLPTKRGKINSYNQITSPSLQNMENALSIEKLLFYGENNDKSQKQINIELKNPKESGRTFEGAIWNSLITQLSNELSKQPEDNNLICVSFGELHEIIDASQLFRLLGNWELFYPTKNLIIFDIDIKLYFELLEINKSFLKTGKNLAYWNSDAITLFYSFFKIKDNQKFYFTDALWGKIRNDFIYINTLIQKNNFNALSYHKEFPKKISNYKQNVKNHFFYNNRALLPFDLLIKDKSNTTIFEHNAKALLCNELKHKNYIQKNKNLTPIQDIEAQITNLPGFKISDSHFRLGSKIHIKDFFYAKRFFQNSFYASRFAFIVSQYILKKHIKSQVLEQLTIIGYGLYSELLLSLTVRYITEYCKGNNLKIKINHNLFTDTVDMKLVKGYETIHDNIAIVVPIASTFSTAMKIEEKLRKFNKNILNPFINVLAISNGSLSLKKEIPEGAIERKYGWSFVDSNKKIVQVSSSFDYLQKKQKYFLSLPTTWFDINTCKKCSPQNLYSSCINSACEMCSHKNEYDICPLSEKPLLTTDKASVTPTFIFGYPKARNISEDEKNRKFLLSRNSFKYGHTERNNQHFHYHIYDEIFLQENKIQVDKWLLENISNKIKRDKICNINYSETDNVLLIAPKHFSNSAFINIVNESIFSNSANILHYDFWNNNIENFQIFYEDIVCDADKIFFIDDSIISGSTLLRCNDFIKQTRSSCKVKKPNNKYGFDACIVLINRTDFFTQKNINRKLKNNHQFFSYANLNLPALTRNSSGKCQLCLDTDKAIDLFNESYLYRFKNTFYLRVKKLKLKQISANFDDINQDLDSKVKPFENTKQNLIKVEFIHRIYEYFIYSENQIQFDSFQNINDWIYSLIEKTETPFDESFIEKNLAEESFSSNSEIMLKVLAHPPFNIYKPIKEKIFEWTIQLLNNQIEIIKNNDFSSLEYVHFRNLKYLIRRVGLINSNYLISERFIHFIIKLYQNNWLDKIIINKQGEIEKIKSDLKGWDANDDSNAFKVEYTQQLIKAQLEYGSIKENIDDFATFVISQMKELLYQNEERCTILEKSILKNHNSEIFTLPLNQFFRILKEENGILLHKFWQYYKGRIINYAKEEKSKNPVSYKNITLEEIIIEKHYNETYLNKIISQNPYQYHSLFEFLKSAEESIPNENFSFRKYIDIQIRLLTQKNDKSTPSLETKTNALFKQLNEFVFESEKESGAFLLVNYKAEGKISNLEDVFLAFNEGAYSTKIENNWKTKNYITKFINGVTNTDKQYVITIEVLEKRNSQWNSLYAKPDEPEINIDFLGDCKGINYLLLIRLSLKKINKKVELDIIPQGVLVFYSATNVFTTTKTRYLLLLKQSISEFINEHHKKEEFRDWVESVKLLTESENAQITIEAEKDKFKQLLELYNKRFEKFAHGAKNFINELHDKIEDNNTEQILLLSYLVKSHINIGELYQKILQEKKKEKKERKPLISRQGKRKHTLYFSEHFNIALDQINQLNDKHKIDYNDFPFNAISSCIPYSYVEFIVFECISNALAGSHDIKIDINLKYNVKDSCLQIYSVGKPIKPLFEIQEFEKHLNSDEPNLEYGIGLYVVNNLIYDATQKPIRVEIDKESKTFIIKIPLQ